MRTATRFGFLALVAAACSEPLAVTSGPLTAQHRANALRLTNASGDPAYYFVVERQTATLIDWVPCVQPACPSVPGNGAIAAPDSLISGLKAGSTEVLVYWWRILPASGGGFQLDSIRTFVVPL